MKRNIKVEPLISVIVPVYKTEKYLVKCVDSIINQTYTNLEIILVNDGSPDSCGAICENLKEKDNRIKVIHKKNSGQSAARNMALDIANGDYFGFIDSDDYIEPDMFEFLFKNLYDNKADISICEFKKVINDEVYEVNSEYYIQLLSKEEALYELIKDEKIASHPCNKLFKRSLFNGIRFPEGRIYEDIAIMHEVFLKAEKIIYSPVQKYFYIIHYDSTSYIQTPKWAYDLYHAFSDRAKFLNKNALYLYEQAFSKAVDHAIGALIHFAKFNKKITMTYEKEICDFLKENIYLIQLNTYLSKRRKREAILVAKFYWLFRIIYKSYFILKNEGKNNENTKFNT